MTATLLWALLGVAFVGLIAAVIVRLMLRRWGPVQRVWSQWPRRRPLSALVLLLAVLARLCFTL